MNPLTTRKFMATCGVIIIASLALALGKLTGSEWVTIATLSLGIFSGANVVAKHKAFTEDSKQ